MATINQNRTYLRSKHKNCTDFSKVGGLSSHIKLLREIIIFPLLYGDLYKHFNIKAPRGVLFFGPPGTGKTLVAGALATELNREGNGKVTFYQRKGADILDKWVGESERKLRDLFHQATRSRPSVIFFDELDGLAPVRSQKNDQVHCSVVATLLALMDGLDSTSGVVIIGATNRIDAVDPALRRPGRFDRELYFPLPSVNARREILEVHISSWRSKPSSEFLAQMSELTSGCCGADLQALCAEAFLCSLKRLYPSLHQPLLGNKVKIEAESIVIEEIDFLNARMNIVPTSQRLGNYRVRKLSPFIKPLLQRQLDKIIRYIQILLPQFTQPFKKFLIGSERYAGRLILKGNNQQGLTVHIVPAILQTLEHIPCFTLDIPALFESNIRNARQNLPSILVLSRVDDWWELIDSGTQLSLTAMLEDLHAGLPLLLIATCNRELPDMLQEYFYNNSSIVMKVEDPTPEEREHFFAPLFFGNTDCSVCRVSNRKVSLEKAMDVKKEVDSNVKDRSCNTTKAKCKRKNKFTQKRRQVESDINENAASELHGKRKLENACAVASKRIKLDGEITDSLVEVKLGLQRNSATMTKHPKNIRTSNYVKNANSGNTLNKNRYSCLYSQRCTCNRSMQKLYSYRNNYQTLVDLIDCTNPLNAETDMLCPRRSGSITSLYHRSPIKQEPLSETSLMNNNPFQTVSCAYESKDDLAVSDIYRLWKRTSHITSAGLAVGELELLYDIISVCIVLHRHSIAELIPSLERTLANFEKSNFKETTVTQSVE